jgi:hypothetical protein
MCVVPVVYRRNEPVHRGAGAGQLLGKDQQLRVQQLRPVHLRKPAFQAGGGKVHALPAAPGIVQVCADTLRAVPAGKVFAWYRDGVLLPFTSRSIVAEQTGSYTVKVRDTNGCFSEPSAPYAFTLEPACFTVYPNPNQGSFQRESERQPQSAETGDCDPPGGQTALEDRTAPRGVPPERFDQPGAAQGIYLVKLHTRKGVFHQRVQIL